MKKTYTFDKYGNGCGERGPSSGILSRAREDDTSHNESRQPLRITTPEPLRTATGMTWPGDIYEASGFILAFALLSYSFKSERISILLAV